MAITQSVSTAVEAARPARSTVGRGTRWWVPWLFLAPNILGLLAFTMIPVVAGIAVAFTKWNVVSGLSGVEFVGLRNFTTLATDVEFWQAAARTVFFAGVGVPASLAFGLLLAMALNQPLFGRAVLRLIFFIPGLVNTVAVGMVWLLVLEPQSGLLNTALRTLGIAHPPGWLISNTAALPALIIIHVWWGMGYQAVIYLAALQDMPPDLYEAATVDGAGWWRKFWTITWPGLMPTTTFLAITSFIGTAQGFGTVAFLTQGGPGQSTTLLAYYMYQNGFQYYRFGYAAAIGVATFFGVLALTLLLWRYQKGRGLYT